MADDLRPSDSLYETDFVAWAEAQAEALRSRGGAGNRLDYENLAEEIGDLGKSEQRACRSFIERIVEHLIKLQFLPLERDGPHWRGEVLAFRQSLDGYLTPTLRKRLISELPDILVQQVKLLERREILDARRAEVARAVGGYTWDQVVDPDWYPEPRYAD